jgi:hypothetical protein
VLRYTIILCLLAPIGVVFGQQPKVYINEFVTHNTKIQDRYREYEDWVEFYNAEDTAVNIAGYFLTDNLANPKAFEITKRYPSLTTIPPKGHVMYWFDKGTRQHAALHVNLKLNNKGEQVGLFAPSGAVVDTVSYGRQWTDIAMGREKDGAKKWVFFTEPTPAKTNNTKSYLGFSAAPTANKQGGFYEGELDVKLFSTNRKAAIYYSTDGKLPQQIDAQRYKTPIKILKTTVVRAITVEEGKLPGEVMTQTYFIDEKSTLPVVSIAIDKYSIFTNNDPKQNLYSESPAHIEYFDADKNRAFGVDAGIRLVGKAIRNYPQKSIAIRLRSAYGATQVEYQLFSQKESKTQSAFLLRNSGNDWSKTLFKDALLHSLTANGMDVDHQAYEPMLVFINNEFWGIHNLREKISRVYIEANYPNVGKIDMFEWGSLPIQGDRDHLTKLEKFVEANDLSIAANYDTVSQMVDMNNFIDYQIAEIFYANTDWPMANMKFWRPKSEGGKWRWILFDTDLAYDLDKRRCPGHHRSLDYALGINNCHIPNFNQSLDKSTYLLQALIKNEDFKQHFIARFADVMNTNFSSKNMLAAIDSLQQRIAPEMPRQVKQWGTNKGIRSVAIWNAEVDKLRQFATERPDTMRMFIREKFELKGATEISFQVTGGGTIQINNSKPSSFPFNGIYFNGIPILVAAVPNPGYKFVSWEGVEQKGDNFTFTPNKAMTITAVFKKD